MITRGREVNMLTVDKVLSADDVRVYKTHARVYALLDTLAARARTLFITANGWDSDGARRDSRITGWIDRGGGEPPQIPPSFRISSLSEVPALLK